MSALRSVFPVMGTMATLTIASEVDGVLASSALHIAKASLEADDHRFSHYTQGSEIMRWLRGEVVSASAQADISYVLEQCMLLGIASEGVFTITDPKTGVIDTAGFVKGHAIAKAEQAIRAIGVDDFSLNVGGDVVCAGRPAADRPWRIAISDPQAPKGIAAIVEVVGGAVATSGTAQRGEHIWHRDQQSQLRSFTVVGPDIALVDAYSTIGFAMGLAGIEWVSAHEEYRSLAIDASGRMYGDAVLLQAA